jgi:hypothetical protein
VLRVEEKNKKCPRALDTRHAPLAPPLPPCLPVRPALSLALAVGGGCCCVRSVLRFVLKPSLRRQSWDNLLLLLHIPKKARRASLSFLRKYEVSPLRLFPFFFPGTLARSKGSSHKRCCWYYWRLRRTSWKNRGNNVNFN